MCRLVLASLLMVNHLATAQSNLEDEDAAQRLFDRRLSVQPVEMAAWQAEVLRRVLATWNRPSQMANSATWKMRVKTDSRGQLLNLSWITPTGNRKLDRSIVKAFKASAPYPAPPDAAAAYEGIEFDDEATSLRRAEEQQAIKRARDAAAMVEIQKAGPLSAYLTLASHRYKKCESVANEHLDITNQRLGITSVWFSTIEECVKAEESALNDEVRLLLRLAPEKVAGEIKDLHAYTIASLRALMNFHQSVMEARQARAERSTGIDERAARISLEL